MDILDKAGKAVGDAVAKARERERFRLQDRIALLDRIAADAAQLTQLRKDRPGGMWDQNSEKASLDMLAASAAIDDQELAATIDTLCGIEVFWESARLPPKAEFDRAYRAVVGRLGQLRRETLAPD